MNQLAEGKEKQCTQSTKLEMQPVSRRLNNAGRELGRLSSKTSQPSGRLPTGFTSTSKPLQTTNSEPLSKRSLSCESFQSEKMPTDPCGRCGCRRQYHNPPPSDDIAKTGGSSGNAHKYVITARTCCYNCKFCICFCVEFIEPFEGQPYTRCVYEV